MIERTAHVQEIIRRLRGFGVVAILGARQIGKTTLAQQVCDARGGENHRFDLENAADLARLTDDPLLALSDLRGLIVLDEVQRRPDLFATLRVLADRRPRRARFLVLGSASPDLLRQSSETLAGRINYYMLGGLALAEVGIKQMDRLWLRGGFPEAYLARSNEQSRLWRESFITTFLERDIPQLGMRIGGATLRRFWAMLAHWHGQIWQSSEFARSFGVADTTVRRYLDLLTDTLVVRQLQPWHANISKRQVKAPKIYVRDSGLLHGLLDIRSRHQLDQHPKLGASWEGFIVEQLVNLLQLSDDRMYFWATHTGAELDLFVQSGSRRLGFEVKRTMSPALTPSMRSALKDLQLTQLTLIHAGDSSFRLAPKVRAIAATRLVEDL